MIYGGGASGFCTVFGDDNSGWMSLVHLLLTIEFGDMGEVAKLHGCLETMMALGELCIFIFRR